MYERFGEKYMRKYTTCIWLEYWRSDWLRLTALQLAWTKLK